MRHDMGESRATHHKIADFDQFSMQKLIGLACAKASKRIHSLSRWSARFDAQRVSAQVAKPPGAACSAAMPKRFF